MANSDENKPRRRSLARFLRILGIVSSSEIQDVGTKTPADSTTYGVFSTDELRHMAGISPNVTGVVPRKPVPTEASVGSYLESVADDTHTKIEELKNLTIVAPEIKMSKRVIVSTIMSPQDLQTNKINITMNYEGLAPEIKNELLDKLNNFFNNEFHLAQRLYDWLSTAGFEEGARALLVLPKHELDVQNAVADVLAAHEDLKQSHTRISASTEALYTEPKDNKRNLLAERVEAEFDVALEHLGADKWFSDGKHKVVQEATESNKTVTISSRQDLVKQLTNGTFKLLKQHDDGSVLVTRDLSYLSRGYLKNSNTMKDLLQDAKAQITGFDPDKAGGFHTTPVRCLSISDNIKIGDDDLPIVLELPSDSVIPVCAPGDNKNHIGYFVLVDENGQPIRGRNNFFKTGSTDVTNRLAMSAAKAVYGNATLTSFSELTSNPEFMLQQMTEVFTVAVNKLLESRLSKDGLTGLDINMHNAVGKALFSNLLANNRITMIFVPEPMMVYYCFDHRSNGTGKTFLEDIAQMLALRTTLVTARLMAAVENATVRRKIEVDIDEKENNPIQTIQAVVRQALSKYAPSFSTEVQTAAESMVNRNIQVVPKSMAGTTDNLSVNYEKVYGNAQSPDTDLLDKLNNWIGMGLGGLPASVLNQLSENEFARSVATTNMYFANTIAGWQLAIKPTNKKFVSLYISSNTRLLKLIKSTLKQEKEGEPEKLEENKTEDVEDESLMRQVNDIIKSLEVDLPAPQMAAKKAHFEEIQSFAEMIEKLVSIIYSDDTVIDDELKGSMPVIRATITSKLLREFLPKLGVQAIADIPEPTAIDADYAKGIFLYLSNLKKRIGNLGHLVKNELPTDAQKPEEDLGGEENPEEAM